VGLPSQHEELKRMVWSLETGKIPAGWMIMMDDFNTRKLRETAFGELKAYREKKAKQTRRIRSWAELKQEFLQNAKDPETKKRVQKMSPKDFEVMMKSIATDDEIEAAMGEGGGGKKASDVTARFPAGKSVDVAKWLRENGHEEAAADWEKYEGKVEDLKDKK
jgi:t-SNARE complex subunit (syntaxin)